MATEFEVTNKALKSLKHGQLFKVNIPGSPYNGRMFRCGWWNNFGPRVYDTDGTCIHFNWEVVEV